MTSTIVEARVLYASLAALWWAGYYELQRRHRARELAEYEEFDRLCKERALRNRDFVVPVTHGRDLTFRIPAGTQRPIRKERRRLARGGARV